MSDILLSYALCFPNLILFKLIPSFPLYYIHHISSILNSVILSSPLPAAIILAFLFLCVFTYLSCVVISFSKDLPNPEIEPRSPTLQADSQSHQGSPSFLHLGFINCFMQSTIRLKFCVGRVYNFCLFLCIYMYILYHIVLYSGSRTCMYLWGQIMLKKFQKGKLLLFKNLSSSAPV